MAAYLIADIDVFNQELYREYTQKASGIVHRFGGCYLVRGAAAESLSGNWMPERLLIIKFDSMERLKECFSCDEYKAIAHLRKESTRSRSVIVEGLAPEENESQGQCKKDNGGAESEIL